MLNEGGPMVGMFEHCTYDHGIVDLRPGDALVIYSDGVTDAGITMESDDEDDAFGQDRLESLVVANATLTASELLDVISSEVTQYAAGGKQFDDITLIVMKVG